MAKDVINAAGGIVWKKISGEYKIALVFRKRHGEKWSLPKGKLQRDESWEKAALREIEEEVGVKAKLITYASTINYLVNDTPKVVKFWHMWVKEESTKTTDAEVKKVEWVTPKEALKKLAYDEEKKLVEGLHFPGNRSLYKGREILQSLSRRFSRRFTAFRSVKFGEYLRVLNPLRFNLREYLKFPNSYRFVKLRQYLRSVSLFRFVKGSGNNTRSERLEGDLHTFRAELDFANRKTAGDDEIPDWAVQARQLLDNAEQALQNNKIDTGWKHLHAARRMQIYGLTAKELKGKADTIRIEAGKLNEWRRKAVFKWLGDPDHPDDEPDAEALVEAAKLRDEHYNNEYYKNRLIENTFRVLLFSMIIWTVAIILYVSLIDVNTLILMEGETRIVSAAEMVIGVILFGLLGGSISSLFHIRDSSGITRIPEIVSHNFVTVVRVFIGAGSALVIFTFLESEFSNLILQNINLQPANPYTYFAISFVAGFTERLLLRAVSSIVGKE